MKKYILRLWQRQSRSEKKHLTLILELMLIALAISLFSCAGPKYLAPDYGLPTTQVVKEKQPNCYDAIQSLNTYNPTMTPFQCLHIVECSEDNANYWQFLYFDLRNRIDSVGQIK